MDFKNDKECHLVEVEIDGEKIEVEFFEYDTDEVFEKYKFSLWDEIIIFFHRIKNRFRNAYYKIHYGFQRMFKDYDSVDTFELFYKFIKRYHKILTEYRKKHYGVPYGMEENEWDNIVGEMLNHLYYMDEDNVEKEMRKGLPNNWFPDAAIVHKIINKHKDEFFELFSKYFYSLWD